MGERITRWIELSVPVNAESVESVTELMSRHGYNQGVVVEEPYNQEEDGESFTIDPYRPVIVRTYFPDDDSAEQNIRRIEEGLWHLRQIGEVGELSRDLRQEEDWANAWKQHFKVLRVGRRFIVRPSWCDYEPAADDLVIHLDPGMAFGTGSHPSSAMSMVLMEDIDFTDACVLDAGAGSGILSVAAILLGARHVDAVEIDPYAAKALAENVRLNALESYVTSVAGAIDAAVAPDISYDIVIANMIARLLVENVDPITRNVAPDRGIIVASGIIEEREEMVVQAFADHGFAPSARRQDGDWVALRLERTSSR